MNATTHDISVYDINEAEVQYVFKYHKGMVVGMVYHVKKNYVISLDKQGVFHYWKPTDGAIPKEDVQYKHQLLTDLYCFRKNKIIPLSLSISKSSEWLGVFASDWQVIECDWDKNHSIVLYF